MYKYIYLYKLLSRKLKINYKLLNNILVYLVQEQKMNQIVYISSPESQQIYVWQLSYNKEKLELIQILHTPGHVQPIAIHPNQQFLYAGIRPDFGIITYYINKHGLLNKINITKLSNSPTYLTVNTTGKFLYCASYNGNTINIIKINELGIPNKIIQNIEGLSGCHSINIDKNKKLIWVPCLQEHSIRLFEIHPITGILTAYYPDRICINIGAGPRHMAFHKTDNYSYVINELNGTINVIKYEFKKIAPIVVQTINILSNNQNIKQFWSSDIHITPNNNWLYCSDRFNHIISCFKICPKTKQLKFIYSQDTEKQPRCFAIDFTGKFLIISGQKSNHISLYRINMDNGKLKIISRYPSGTGPMWVSINPFSKFTS